MIKVTVQNLLLLGCVILLIHGVARSAASISSKDSFLGVSPDDLNYYRGLSSSGSIKCKDGSKIFNKSQFNDDFCDCIDGSDEPGTSACPNGKFYCKNAGHAPVILYSSRVNDGICDCCDGSDEYDGKTKCSNTCWEAGKVAREKLRKKIATFKEGVTIRQKEIEQGKLAMEKDEGELLKLKDEEKILKELVEKIKERKELIEKAEEKERLQKEKEEKERKEAEETNEKETKAEDNEPTQNDIHDDAGTVDQPSQDSVEDHNKLVNEPELIDHSIKNGPPNDGVDDNDVSLQNTEHERKEANFDDKAGLDTGNQNTEHQGNEASFDDKASLGTENEDENIVEDIETLSREELGRRIASRWTGEKTEQIEEEDASIDKKHAFPDETPNDINDDENNGYGSDDDEHKSDDDEHKYDDDEHKYDDDEHTYNDDEHKYNDDKHKYDDDEDKYDADEEKYDDDDESEDQIDSSSYDDDHKYYDSSSSPKPESDDEFDSSDDSSWLEKIQKKVKNIFQAVNVFQKPVNISEAAHVRKEYDESSAKLTKIQSRISSLKRKLKQDFGPEKEFYSFYGQCFETKQNKYVYKVCPFKEATQVEGHSTTRLGSWEKFEDSYRVLQFSNGEKCWNGPDRSLKVKLRCGLKNELADVDEPSRCEYMALLSTPALCLDSRLKELQNKLETLGKDQPQEHDEL